MQQSLDVFQASDGYPLHYRSYRPLGSTEKAHLICIHGIQSHGGWYKGSCRALAAAGYRVSYLDRRGSGLNWLRRGDVSGYGRLLDDLREFINSTSDLPPILLATSWGGKLALALADGWPNTLKKLVLLCPGIFPRVKPPLKVRLGIARSRALRPGRLYPIPLSDPKLFTASSEGQRFIASDPLALHHATARFLVESVRLDRRVRSIRSLPNLPLLLLLAEHDAIIRNDKTETWLKSIAPQTKVIHYPGSHHTFEFEPNHPFVRDILQWIEGGKT